MAYAYPSGGTGDAGSSQVSLLPHTHSGQHSREVSRKSSEGGDVLREFKDKIQEDEHYINFFAERIRVEELYIENLTKLYDRSVAVDSLHHDPARKNPRTTTRRAWTEVRDYTLREIQSREALVSALKEDVVKELVKLKEEQSRIRLGLKDNMRHATEMYEHHLRTEVPKLKKAYWSKCQAVEDHRRQEHAIQMQAKLLSSASTTDSGKTQAPPEAQQFSSFYYGTQAGLSPPASNPPLAPLANPAQADASPSHDKQIAFSPTSKGEKEKTGRLRAGSGSGGDGKTKDVFNDIANQSKKGFKELMQRLGGDKDGKDKDREESGFVVVGDEGLQRRGTNTGTMGKAAGAMKGVKVKRDAEEADKAYRLGVFHLESLRLRRDKLQSSAVNNLETFNDELNSKLRVALERYIDTMHGTAATQAQSTEVARQAIESINLEQDIMVFRSKLRSVSSLHTAPVPYENFYVGPCKSLIFGVQLTDYDFARGEGSDHGRPPAIVEKCIAAIDDKGLGAEGIYRISGRHAGVQKMVQDIERDEEKFTITSDKEDVYTIASVLKQYLRELPEPVFPLPHAERVKYTTDRETHIHNNFASLRSRLRRLPPIHQTTFQAIIEHLARVAAQSAVNRMDAKNLAVVFNSVLFGADQLPTDGNVLLLAQEKDTVLEDLITFSDLLFGDDFAPAPAAVPLGVSAAAFPGAPHPRVPEDPRQPGSSRTKIQITSPNVTPERLPQAQDVSTSRAAGLPMPSPSFEESITTATFTADVELDLLFDPTLIPSTLQDGVDDQYHVRPLSSTDLMRSHFPLLSTLTASPPMAPSVYAALFTHMRSCPATYYIIVVVERATDQLVAAGTLFVERKHIHGGGVAGHIEDIVVAPTTRGQGLGQKLVNGLREMGVALGCYKVLLDCKEDKIPFYEKCGFAKRGTQMTAYVSNLDASPAVGPTVPPGTAAPGSSALLPARVSPPTLPPRPVISTAGVEKSETEQVSPTTSSSSGGTYSYPVVSLGVSPVGGPPTSGATVPPPSAAKGATGPSGVVEPIIAEGIAVPAWAGEGLGASEPPSAEGSPTDATGSGGVKEDERINTPLPPGAAPPVLSSEPERISPT